MKTPRTPTAFQRRAEGGMGEPHYGRVRHEADSRRPRQPRCSLRETPLANELKRSPDPVDSSEMSASGASSKKGTFSEYGLCEGAIASSFWWFDYRTAHDCVYCSGRRH